MCFKQSKYSTTAREYSHGPFRTPPVGSMVVRPTGVVSRFRKEFKVFYKHHRKIKIKDTSEVKEMDISEYWNRKTINTCMLISGNIPIHDCI